MKSFISTILFLMLFTVIGYSQNVKIDSNAVNINVTAQDVGSVDIPDSVQVTFNKVYEDMKAGIAGLAQSLKVGTEYVWNILVKQQLVKSICYLIISLVLIIVAIIFYKRMKYNEKEFKIKEEKRGTGYGRDNDSNGIASILFGILFVVCIGLNVLNISFNINTILTGFINPEFGAIQDIINFTK